MPSKRSIKAYAWERDGFSAQLNEAINAADRKKAVLENADLKENIWFLDIFNKIVWNQIPFLIQNSSIIRFFMSLLDYGVPMQSKIKREFVPEELKDVYVDFYWSQEKLWNLNLNAVELEVSELEWILKYPIWYMDPHPIPIKVMEDSRLDDHHWNRMLTADLNFPIHVLKWNGRLLILDGVHRLMKAKSLGALKINGKVLTEEHIPEILPTEDDFKKGFLKQFGNKS